ncbi:unnamed protein product, partial [Arabidopsis halleri]
MLAYGYAADAVDEYLWIGETTSFDEFRRVAMSTSYFKLSKPLGLLNILLGGTVTELNPVS